MGMAGEGEARLTQRNVIVREVCLTKLHFMQKS